MQIPLGCHIYTHNRTIYCKHTLVFVHAGPIARTVSMSIHVGCHIYRFWKTTDCKHTLVFFSAMLVEQFLRQCLLVVKFTHIKGQFIVKTRWYFSRPIERTVSICQYLLVPIFSPDPHSWQNMTPYCKKLLWSLELKIDEPLHVCSWWCSECEMFFMGPNYLHQFQNVNSEFQQQVAVEKTLGGLLYLVQAANQKPSQAGDCYIFFLCTDLFQLYKYIYIYGNNCCPFCKNRKNIGHLQAKKTHFSSGSVCVFRNSWKYIPFDIGDAFSMNKNMWKCIQCFTGVDLVWLW